jgi:hypothetical protein
MYSGHLYRPAQDCSKKYGGAVVLNRVTKLTPSEFQEEQASIIAPYKNSPFPDGIHTTSSVGEYTLIDGKRRILNFDIFSIFAKLYSQVKRI